MPAEQWYWGAVVRVDAAAALLTAVGGLVDGEQVRAQDPQTGHITLFYAPPRGGDEASALARRVGAAVAGLPAFDLRCTGFGEFPSATRPVAWLDIAAGSDVLRDLRTVLCGCDEDCHRHDFVPHLTLAYGEDAAAYLAVRDAIRGASEPAEVRAHIDAIWIAGFPVSGHPARDLRYVERVPLADG